MTQEIIPAYSTFQKYIDLTLYHAFAELVVQTAQDGEARILYRQLEARQIWQEDQNVSSYFEAYSLRYPGEVLERFEEKLGTDIRILRALALALGYTRRCQADTMFVGNQRNDFIQKLRRTAGTDVYLQGALYLLETDALRRRTRLDELAAREYARTEEALFVLSLFDDPETGYQAMRPQLTRLFGPERTISRRSGRWKLDEAGCCHLPAAAVEVFSVFSILRTSNPNVMFIAQKAKKEPASVVQMWTPSQAKDRLGSKKAPRKRCCSLPVFSFGCKFEHIQSNT